MRPEALDPPFGAHALPNWLERLRLFGGRLGRSAFARRAVSLIRRACLLGRPDPVDVVPFPGQRARLYPRDNLSEKRVFSAPQFWDWAERCALARAMSAAPQPFFFVDAGANAGLYTLAVRSLGPARILAIEPEPEALRRLRANLAASGAVDVQCAPVGLSDRPGVGRIAVPAHNRGEAALGAAGAEIALSTLWAEVRSAGFPRVDALKIDIEGAEERVLAAFMAEAPRALWPRLVILEAQRGAQTAALAQMVHRGYEIQTRTRMNAILSLPVAAQEQGAPEPAPALGELNEADGKT